MRSALRRIPMPLLLAQLAGVVIPLFLIVLITIEHAGDWNNLSGILLLGSSYAIPVLTLVGLAWLARGLAGAALTGTRIAMVATAVSLAVSLIWPALIPFSLHWSPELLNSLIHVEWAVRSTCAVCVAVGLGIATRRWFWIPIGAFAAILAEPIWFVWSWLYDDGTDRSGMSSHQLALIQGAVQLAMVAVASRHAAASEEPAPLGRGLARSGLALRGLAIATTVLAGLTILLGTQHDNDRHASILLAIGVATAFEVACLVALALGALATIRGRSELPAWLVGVVSGVALAVAGNLARRIFSLVLRSVEEHAPLTRVRLVPAVSSQLLVALAIGALVVALAIGARRRGLEELRARALTSTCVLIALAIAAITGQQVIADSYELTPLSATILATTNTALVAAWLIGARVIRGAAGELIGGQYLPTAKVIR